MFECNESYWSGECDVHFVLLGELVTVKAKFCSYPDSRRRIDTLWNKLEHGEALVQYCLSVCIATLEIICTSVWSCRASAQIPVGMYQSIQYEWTEISQQVFDIITSKWISF